MSSSKPTEYISDATGCDRKAQTACYIILRSRLEVGSGIRDNVNCWLGFQVEPGNHFPNTSHSCFSNWTVEIIYLNTHALSLSLSLSLSCFLRLNFGPRTSSAFFPVSQRLGGFYYIWRRYEGRETVYNGRADGVLISFWQERNAA